MLYEGKPVIIEGKFGGWSGRLPCDYDKIRGYTRSDTIIMMILVAYTFVPFAKMLNFYTWKNQLTL